MLTHVAPPTNNSSYPLSKVLSYGSLSPSHRDTVLNVASQFEPQFYHQASDSQNGAKPCNFLLDAMEQNKTWTVVPLPIGKHTIGCRWIYKLKYKYDGTIDRHKASLVVRGYTQQEGIDFFETFSPIAKLVTLKVLLAIVANWHWHLHQLDVNNAFLDGDLVEAVYMDLPLGYKR